MSLELDQKLYHLARLRIDNVAKEDAGEYRAVAKNKHGQGVATINLNFEGGDKLKYALNVLLRVSVIASHSSCFHPDDLRVSSPRCPQP